jgi:hypothetical protein
LAERDGISRRYIRRLIGLAFLSPELVEAILQGRQPVELTATRLTELDCSAAISMRPATVRMRIRHRGNGMIVAA